MSAADRRIRRTPIVHCLASHSGDEHAFERLADDALFSFRSRATFNSVQHARCYDRGFSKLLRCLIFIEWPSARNALSPWDFKVYLEPGTQSRPANMQTARPFPHKFEMFVATFACFGGSKCWRLIWADIDIANESQLMYVIMNERLVRLTRKISAILICRRNIVIH